MLLDADGYGVERILRLRTFTSDFLKHPTINNDINPMPYLDLLHIN
jgi:hypothetical protein